MSISATELAVAFAAGAVSIASPCVWPLLPGYVSFVTGAPAGEAVAHQRRALLAAGGFVLGFTAVFTIAGAGAGLLGGLFLDHRRGLELVGGAIVIGFGILMLLPRSPLASSAWTRMLPDRPTSLGGAALAGAAFAVAWTPCIGKTLGAILTIAGAEGRAGDGAVLLLAYSIGLGIPFMAVALGAHGIVDGMTSIRRHWPLVTRVSGAVLVVTGVLIATGSLTDLTARLAG